MKKIVQLQNKIEELERAVDRAWILGSIIGAVIASGLWIVIYYMEFVR